MADGIDELAEDLSRALRDDLGSERLPDDGYAIDVVEPRTFQRRVALVLLRRGDTTLGFLVAPTDPAEPAYKRTTRYDVVYFSEDVPDPDQHIIYKRDRAMIDRFSEWVARWDERGG